MAINMMVNGEMVKEKEKVLQFSPMAVNLKVFGNKIKKKERAF